MIWEDIVIAVGCFSLALALIPSIRKTHKPEKSSCALSVICLTALAISFASLGLWLSVASEIAGIITWGILLFQKRYIPKIYVPIPQFHTHNKSI